MKEVLTNHHELCEAALEALRQVTDPEIGLNIVDLGLVYQVDFETEARQLYATMTLTTQFCPMGESIRNHALAALQATFPDYFVHLELVFDPPWKPERISEEGREFLNR